MEYRTEAADSGPISPARYTHVAGFLAVPFSHLAHQTTIKHVSPNMTFDTKHAATICQKVICSMPHPNMKSEAM